MYQKQFEKKLFEKPRPKLVVHRTRNCPTGWVWACEDSTPFSCPLEDCVDYHGTYMRKPYFISLVLGSKEFENRIKIRYGAPSWSAVLGAVLSGKIEGWKDFLEQLIVEAQKKLVDAPVRQSRSWIDS